MATTVQIFMTGSEQAVVEVIDEAVGLGVQAGRRAIGSTEADPGKVDVSDDELLAVARVAARVAEAVRRATGQPLQPGAITEVNAETASESDEAFDDMMGQLGDL